MVNKDYHQKSAAVGVIHC